MRRTRDRSKSDKQIFDGFICFTEGMMMVIVWWVSGCVAMIRVFPLQLQSVSSRRRAFRMDLEG